MPRKKKVIDNTEPEEDSSPAFTEISSEDIANATEVDSTPVTSTVTDETNQTNQLLTRLIQLQEQTLANQIQLDKNIQQTNINLTNGYKATHDLLTNMLSPLAEAAKSVPQNPQPQQSGGSNNTPSPQGTGGNGQYYQPSGQAVQGQGQNGQQNNGWNGLPPEAVAHIIDKMLGPDQNAQGNIFNMLGQRMFAEMVTTNMMTNRALIRNMHAKGSLTKEEADQHMHLQDTLYAPFIGGMTGIGQPQPLQQPQQQQQQPFVR